jgi:hypothetical protein
MVRGALVSCASTPIAAVAVDGVDQTLSVPVVATVMPIASVGCADISRSAGAGAGDAVGGGGRWHYRNGTRFAR